ncbi:MAG: hypothetical protein ACPIOQ_07795 [Promethearchaeia archaeon]
MLNPFEVSLEVMEEGANQEAEVVAQHFYITLITLASFDKSGRLNRRITPEHIWDLANLRAKVFQHFFVRDRVLAPCAD